MDPPKTDFAALKPALTQHILSKTNLFWTAVRLLTFYER
jgi:hypothetical protein